MTLPIQEDEIQKELDIICGNHVIMHSSEIKKRVSALIAKARIDELSNTRCHEPEHLLVCEHNKVVVTKEQRLKQLKDGDE